MPHMFSMASRTSEGVNSFFPHSSEASLKILISPPMPVMQSTPSQHHDCQEGMGIHHRLEKHFVFSYSTNMSKDIMHRLLHISTKITTVSTPDVPTT